MMKHMFLILSLLFIGFSSHALTLKEKKQLADWRKDLNDPEKTNKHVKRHCGVEIPVTMDDALATPFLENHTSASAYCDAPRSQIWNMCEQDATYKESIVKGVKKITCKLGKPKEVAFELKGTELIMSVGVGASNLAEKTKEFLENKL